MKILIISEFFPNTENGDIRGGMELRAYELARRISKIHSVTVIASKEKNESNIKNIAGINVMRVGRPRSYVASGGYFDRIIFQALAFYRALFTDFDIVEGSGFFAWAPAYTASLVRRRPRVIVFADDIDEYLITKSKIVRGLLHYYQKFIIQRKWDLFISISRTSLNKIKSYINISNNVKVIYCGINQKLISSIKSSKYSNRIICVSRLVKYKRIDDLIFACKRIMNENIDFELHIVGSGDEGVYLKQLSISLGLQKYVKFYGFIRNHKQVLKLIKSSSVFCLPSTVEGFGIAVIESLAAGVPAVICNLPIHHEISKGRGTVYYRAQDPKDLAKKIKSILLNSNYRNKLGRYGKQISHEYDWNKISNKVLKEYENLCNY